MRLRSRLLITAPVILSCLAGGQEGVQPALAQGTERAVTRPVPSGADPLRKVPADGADATKDKGAADATGAPDGASSNASDDPYPSSGVTLYQRMGSDLPAVPPEKAYHGPIDEAYGAYQRGRYMTALDKALPRAEAGDAAAQTLVAEMMTRGLGIVHDAKGAAFWYGEAAKRGDPAAMFQYALLLMEGRNVPRDKAKADDYMRRAAEAGNASAQFNWGQILVADNPGEKGLKLALPFYEKSAEQGVADAQYAVSQLYEGVKDIAPEKKAKAREWLLRAAKAGYDTAQLDAGIWFVNGVGGPRDYEQGFEWLRIAATRGNVVAQNKLAHLYIYALGTRPNPVEAAKWYVLSRRAGLADPVLEDFYLGINEDQQKQAIDAANRFRRG
ncbi:tetratricopeptide repeat protein [Rhizobium sp. SGZ-381]|uniref:tetratricopeptide repeat protein n=1 Tax=Rhizobium sp. SGZ-381 TaxID=3342800 RepID=UPI00366ADB3A